MLQTVSKTIYLNNELDLLEEIEIVRIKFLTVDLNNINYSFA